MHLTSVRGSCELTLLMLHMDVRMARGAWMRRSGLSAIRFFRPYFAASTTGAYFR
jgi:hypothetical protein